MSPRQELRNRAKPLKVGGKKTLPLAQSPACLQTGSHHPAPGKAVLVPISLINWGARSQALGKRTRALHKPGD